MLEIRTPALRRLHDDWDSRCRGREFPARADFDVLELGYIVGHLSLLDVLHDPLRFRFRVHASHVGDRVGYEMTGKDLADLPAPDMREVVHRHFVEVLARRAPVVQIRDRQILDDRLVSCEVLVLPLSRDGQIIDMIMSGLIWL